MNNKEKLIKAFGTEVKNDDIDTFRGWISRGRIVMLGQKSLCKLSRPVNIKGETQFRVFPVFHINQTAILESKERQSKIESEA